MSAVVDGIIRRDRSVSIVNRQGPVKIVSGAQGPRGVQGAAAGGIRLTVDTSTVDSDPGTGKWRADSVTFASITKLWIDNAQVGSGDITAWLDALDDGGTSAYRCVLRFENLADSAQWAEFIVTGSVTDKTGYRELAVTPRAQVGWPFTNAAATIANFFPNGIFDLASPPAIGGTTPNAVDATRVKITGTAGAGYLELLNQSATPGTPSSAARVFVDASNRFSWVGTNGYKRSLDGTANTADRAYTLPDANCSLAPLASPTFTGTPAAPTASARANTTQLATTAYVDAAARDKLTANRTYYVRTDGSNSNTGLADTSGAAFLTVQKALDVVFGTLDLGGFNVTIQVGDGTYTTRARQLSAQVGAGSVTINGNSGTPTNVVFSTTSQSCVEVSNHATLTIANLKMQTTTGGNCLWAHNFGTISLGAGLNFGACVDYHMVAEDHGLVSGLNANYTILGGAGFHIYANSLGEVYTAGATCNIPVAKAFTYFAIAGLMGILKSWAMTITGAGVATCTGTRYYAHTNSVIYVAGGGASYFPGDVAGSTATGGQYS